MLDPEDIMRQNLIALAQAYADAKGWSLSTVSKQIHGNQAFLAEYLAGQSSPTIRTYFQMIHKLRTNWPKPERGEGGKFGEGVPWPETSPIPKLGKKVDKVAEAA